MRRALALTLDRDAFNDILHEGKGLIGGTMLPPPAGVWGMPKEMVDTLLGYGDVEKDREEAREIRSEEHTSELQSLMRISYAVFCLKKKKKKTIRHNNTTSKGHDYKDRTIHNTRD